MKKKFHRLAALVLTGILLAASFTACQGSAAPPLTSGNESPGLPSPSKANQEISVFAGAASKPPLDEAARAFEKQTGIKVYLTYGGSGSVLSQMKLAKTGDIYIPGSPDYMIKAENDNLVDPASVEIIAYLVPVIAVQRGNPKNIQSLSDLTKPGIRVGIGNPGAVCLGLYSIEIFNYNDLPVDLNKNVVTQADSCEKAASLISLKAVDAIIGWDVFSTWAPDYIEIVYLQPEQTPRLAYIPAAISTFSRDKEGAAAFIDFLTSAEGQEIFKNWGYKVTEAEVRQYAPDAKIGGEYQYR